MPEEGLIARITNAFRSLKAAPLYGGSSSHNGTGWGGHFSFGQRDFDYQRTDPLASSPVMICLGWVTRNFPQGRFEVVRHDGPDKKVVDDHELTRLIANPNTWYSSQRLWAGTLIDYNVGGDAYWLKVRPSIAAKPTELWYLPAHAVRPVWPDDDSKYISYYEYTDSRGRRVRIDVEDVVHFRNGLDPRNQRMGLSPLKAVLLEVFTDLEASRFTAALLKNYAVPGVAVIPGEDTSMSPEQAEAFKQKWKRRFGGDNRGEPVILSAKADVKQISFSPEQMDLAELRKIPEARIAGALGIPPIVVGLNVGLERSTYSNTEQATAAAFEQNLIPTYYTFAEEITNQLLVDFDRTGRLSAHFETGHIKALQENETDKQERARANFLAGGISRNQYREKIGEAAEEFDYILIPSNVSAKEVKDGRLLEPLKAPVPAQLIEGEPQEQRPERMLPPAEDEEVKSARKLYDFDGLPLSREPTAAERVAVKGVAASQDAGKRRVAAFLLEVRERMLDEAVSELSEMMAGEYYTLNIDPVMGEFKRLKRILVEVYNEGRRSLTNELEGQKVARDVFGYYAPKSVKAVDEEDDDLDTLTDLTLSRVANDFQSRAIGAAVSLATLGLTGQELKRRLRSSLEELSTAPQELAGMGAANRALSLGRRDEAEARSNEWGKVQYSAILDLNTCPACEEADGTEAGDPLELPPAPNGDCEGLSLCRCFHVFVTE